MQSEKNYKCTRLAKIERAREGEKLYFFLFLRYAFVVRLVGRRNARHHAANRKHSELITVGKFMVHTRFDPIKRNNEHFLCFMFRNESFALSPPWCVCARAFFSSSLSCSHRFNVTILCAILLEMHERNQWLRISRS